MVRPLPIIHASIGLSSTTVLAAGLFVSATLLVGLCMKHSRKVHTKHGPETKDPNPPPIMSATKAMALNTKKLPPAHAAEVGGKDNHIDGKEGEKENGVWQKAILMGEKCQPPEFPGVIYYDYCGNRISEMPKSPRVTSMSPLRGFTFPMKKNEGYVH